MTWQRYKKVENWFYEVYFLECGLIGVCCTEHSGHFDSRMTIIAPSNIVWSGSFGQSSLIDIHYPSMWRHLQSWAVALFTFIAHSTKLAPENHSRNENPEYWKCTLKTICTINFSLLNTRTLGRYRAQNSRASLRSDPLSVLDFVHVSPTVYCC